MILSCAAPAAVRRYAASLLLVTAISNLQSGEKETDFFDVVAWRANGEFVSKYFTKGRMVVVEGRLQVREWQDKEGNKRRSAEINADNVYFGDSRPAQTEGASGTGEADAFKDFPPLDDFPSAAGSSDKELPF